MFNIIIILILGAVFIILNTYLFTKIYDKKVSLLILIVGMAIISFSSLAFLQLELSEVDTSPNANIIVQESHYNRMNFEDEDIGLFFNKYNIYFGCTTDSGVCITDNASNEAIQYLNDKDINYYFVEFNYTELFSIYNLIINNDNFQDFKGVSIDYQSNIIELTVPVDYTIPDNLEYYTDLGVLIVSESDLENSIGE